MVECGFIYGLVFGVCINEEWGEKELVIALGFIYITVDLGGVHGISAWR